MLHHVLLVGDAVVCLLGHESTGVVLAVGQEVRHVREGDKVMLT